VGYGGVVATGEYGSCFGRAHGVLQGEPDAGASFAGGATADGIDHHHDGATAGSEDLVDLFGGARFFNAKAREIFAHGD
jgi:hypothetical protein